MKKGKRNMALLLCAMMTLNESPLLIADAAGSKNPVFTDETGDIAGWIMNGATSTNTDVKGNDTYKITLGNGNEATYNLEEVLRKGEFQVEYEVYNTGAANGFMILDSEGNALVNVGGAGSGNMNIMPEKTTSGVVNKWVALLKNTWTKVSLTVDLDKSNQEGILSFEIRIYKTDTYAGADSEWELVDTCTQDVYINPPGNSSGGNKAAPHANGAATDGLTSFNIAGIYMVSAGNTVYYDNISVRAGEVEPSSVTTPLYTDETTEELAGWTMNGATSTNTELKGNNTYKLTLGNGNEATYNLEEALRNGKFQVEYEVYNTGAANGFMILDSEGNALVNVGGAGSGNMNIMPEKTTSGVVNKWVALLKNTWTKVSLTVDLDKSNQEGILSFEIKIYKTNTHAGADTEWELIDTCTQDVYINPPGNQDGGNKAAPHTNGAATDGLESFNIASIHMVSAGNTVYYDNMVMTIGSEASEVTGTLESIEISGISARYLVGSTLSENDITVTGKYVYHYPDRDEYLRSKITDYELTYDFSQVGDQVPVTIKVNEDGKELTETVYVKVYELGTASYLNLQYTDEDNLSEIGLSGATVQKGSIGATDNSNETNKIQVNKGTASISFEDILRDGIAHFETEFLTMATKGASLFMRLVNSEGETLVDIGQYGSSNLNLYLNNATSGDTVGQFKGLTVKKWAKASIDIDLDASKEQGHLVFTAVVYTTDRRGDGTDTEWTEFARFTQNTYISGGNDNGAASSNLTLFDVAGIQLYNAGGSANYYDNLLFEGIGAQMDSELLELEMISAPSKTTYLVGESFDSTGLVLMGTYKYTFEDGSTKVTRRAVSGYSVDFDNTTVSENSTITLSVDGKSVSFQVSVEPNTLLDAMAGVIVDYVDNDLVTLNSDGTISLNKRNIMLPGHYGRHDLSYSTTSEGAKVENNILSVTPSTEGKTKVELNITVTSAATGVTSVQDKVIVFDVEQASSTDGWDGILVDEEEFRTAVETLIENGVISGQDRLNSAEAVMAALDGPIKVEEFVSMLINAFDVDTTYTDTVINRSDIDYSAWYAEDIIAAYQLSIEPKASRENGGKYGIGQDLTAEDAEFMIGRIEAIEQKATGGIKYEQGLPSQVDSSPSLVNVLDPLSDMEAFPGAEGYAKYVTGGRGGKVIHVTNLNSDGEGSFLAALYNGGNITEPRIIVFDVSGTIDWTKNNHAAEGTNYKMLNFENVTIAGQTAPGDGITLINGNFYFAHCKNMIIRFLNFRYGQTTNKDDSCYVENSDNIMIDHCSFSYGGDESMSARHNKNLTIQWSIIADGVRTHSMGGLQEWNSQSIVYSLLANQNDRNPKAKGVMDFVNNVVFNWGTDGFVAGGNSGGQCWANVINNYFVAGLDSRYPHNPICRSNGKFMLYAAGNMVDSNKNGMLDGVNRGIEVLGRGGDEANYEDRFTFEDLPLVLLPERMYMSDLYNTVSADDAYNAVMAYVGASVHGNTDGTTSLQRDEVDAQIVNGVMNQTGKLLVDNAENTNEDGVRFDKEYFANYPKEDANDPASPYYESKRDTDGDGMPDVWEVAHGLNPSDPEDRNTIAPSGYTYIEEYLNELAAPAFPKEDEDAADLVQSYDTAREYEMELIYGDEVVSYKLYNTDNNVMVPLAPVLEYLGFKVTKADAESVVAEYPYATAEGNLNLDTIAGVHTVKAGDETFKFSTWTWYNDAATVYNDMIYVPVSMVSLALNGVYDQKIVDTQNNKSVISIHDAEVFKTWHTGNEVRDARKKSAPLVSFYAADAGLRLVFDKEATIANASAPVVITDSQGNSYTAELGKATVWGSNKVFELKWTDFVSGSGASFAWNAGDYTVTVGEGAIADTYNSNLVTAAISGTINGTSQVATVTVPAVQALADNLYALDEQDNTNTGEAMQLRAAIKMVYELLAEDNVNKTNYDIINGSATDNKSMGWVEEDGELYWYENGVKQGTEGRGKEIYDPESDGWYWLDAEFGGRVAKDKDVFMDSNGGKWVRYDADGKMVKGWDEKNGGRYYFDLETGAMAKGTVTIEGEEYYFNEVTGIMQSSDEKDGFRDVDGELYWYENGVKQGTEGRGKEIYDPETKAWYWLDAERGGAVAKGKDVFMDSNGGKWVRYDENGHMIKGWDRKDGNMYYFDEETGAMAKGTMTIEGEEYYFNLVTGIKQDEKDGFREEDGATYWYENGVKQGTEGRGKEIYDPETDAWYWLDAEFGGCVAKSKDVFMDSDGGKWVRYDENGHMVKGWNTTDAGTYYFDPETGAMAKGQVVIDGEEHIFDQETGIKQ